MTFRWWIISLLLSQALPTLACVVDADCSGEEYCNAMGNCEGTCADFCGGACGSHSKCTAVTCADYSDQTSCDNDSHCTWNSGGHGSCLADFSGCTTDPVCYYSGGASVPELNSGLRRSLFLLIPIFVIGLTGYRKRKRTS